VSTAVTDQLRRLYEDAAHKLNMSALVGFLTELCASSQRQLTSLSSSTIHSSNGLHVEYESLPQNALLIFRLGDIMSKCVRSDRPLLHIMRAWNVVSPHLIEVNIESFYFTFSRTQYINIGYIYIRIVIYIGYVYISINIINITIIFYNILPIFILLIVYISLYLYWICIYQCIFSRGLNFSCVNLSS